MARLIEITEKDVENLSAAFPKAMSIRQSAYLCELPDTTVGDWLRRGDEDRREGNHDTLCAKLSRIARKAQAIEAVKLLDKMKEGSKTWGAHAWLLERCFREDFGVDSHDIQEIKENFVKLRELLEKKNA